MKTSLRVAAFFALPIGVLLACGSSERRGAFTDENDGGTGPIIGSEAGGFEASDLSPCAQAAAQKAYVGCEYWPTVTSNLVNDVFDFAVAIANVGTEDANVTVTGPSGTNEKVTVKGGSLEKVYLPWIASLKGGENGITQSVFAKAGAYHLVSDRPVVVYQFNPLEFRAVGGKPGKDWSKCVPQIGSADCYSYSNDASLLLPTTALTGTYRIMGSTGFSRHPANPFTGELDTTQPVQALAPAFFAVTATADGTNVTVKLGSKARVVAGGSIKAADANGDISFTMDAGDVAEIVAPNGRDYDFSGSLLTADKPVQVIAGVPCMDFPFDTQACDHVEETVFPAETLGKHYVVMRPTGPFQNDVAHVVRIYGNQDGTTLTYKPSKPASCPSSISAGEVIECGEVSTDFEIAGDKEFGVGMFMLGGEKTDPNYDSQLQQPQGDPSQSFAVGVEQFRPDYVFLAPTDYKTSFVDVIAQAGTNLKLDGIDKSGDLRALSGTDYYTARIKLSNGVDGVHTLNADKPVGIQVMGYGDNTTYMYPGGLNLGLIAPPPVK